MMRPRWRKVLQDLWQSKARAALVVLSIAVGVFAVGTTMAIRANLTRDLQSSYKQTNPMTAMVMGAPFPANVVDAVRKLPGIKEVEGRLILSLRVQDGQGNWKPFELQAIPSFGAMRINTVYPDGGSWPPLKGEILLERASLPLLAGVEQGGTVRLEMPDKTVRELAVTGLTYDANRFPAGLSGVPGGYVSMETLGESPVFNHLLFTVTGDQLDQGWIGQVADGVQEKMRSLGAVPGGFYVPPAAPPAESAVSALMLLMLAIGAASLVMSGFLINNTVTAILSEQVRQMGTMKAIGATRAQLAGMYLVMTLLLSGAAFLVALPATWIASDRAVALLGSLVNSQRESSGIPPIAVLLQLVLALAVPLLSAAGPVIRGTRLTVSEALSDHGSVVGGSSLAARSRLPRSVLYALRSALRRKGRLVRTIITLSLAGATFIGILGVQQSLRLTAQEYLHHYNYDFAIRFERPYPREQVLREAAALLGPAKAGTWIRSGATIRSSDGVLSQNYDVIALDPGSDFLHPQLLAGRWLDPTDTTAVVIDHSLLRSQPGLHVGSHVVIKSEGKEGTVHVVGIVKAPIEGMNLYVNESYMAERAGLAGMAGTLMVQAPALDVGERAKLGEALKDHFDKVGLRVVTLNTAAEAEMMIMSQFNLIITFLLAMSLLLAVVGAIGLAGTLGMNVLERTREIGIMRAIGAWPGRIFFLVTLESVLIGLASWGVGAILAVPVSKLLGVSVGVAFLQTPLTFSFSAIAVALWFAMVLVLAVLSSLLPAWRATKGSVREALAHQ